MKAVLVDGESAEPLALVDMLAPDVVFRSAFKLVMPVNLPYVAKFHEDSVPVPETPQLSLQYRPVGAAVSGPNTALHLIIATGAYPLELLRLAYGVGPKPDPERMSPGERDMSLTAGRLRQKVEAILNPK